MNFADESLIQLGVQIIWLYFFGQVLAGARQYDSGKSRRYKVAFFLEKLGLTLIPVLLLLALKDVAPQAYYPLETAAVGGLTVGVIVALIVYP